MGREKLALGDGARVGHRAYKVDSLVCETLKTGLRETEGTVGSLTSGDEGAVNEGESILGPGDAAGGVGATLKGLPLLLGVVEGR